MIGLIALLLSSPTYNLDEVTVKQGDTPPTIIAKVMKGYDLCLYSNARRYALGTNETADVVVESTLGSCSQWDSTYRDAIILLVPSLPPHDVDDLIARFKSTRRPQLSAYVLDTRMKKRARRRN